LNVGEQFLDEGFYEIIEFFEGLEACGKKDSTTSLNVGEQFSDEGFYEIIEFFEGLEACGKKDSKDVIECRRAIFRQRIL
jgi:hypothetical protein